MNKNKAMDENNPYATSPIKSEGRVHEFSYFPILFDFIARWLCLGYWLSEDIGTVFFWILNIVVIPIISVILITNRGNDFNQGDTIQYSRFSKVFTFLVLFSGVAVTWVILNDLHLLLKILLTIITFVVYGYYLLILFGNSRKKVKKDHKWKTNMPQMVVNKNSNKSD